VRLDAGRLGSARLYAPHGPLRGFVFLYPDAGAALDGVAAALARAGAASVVVDLPEYLRRLAASDDGCHYLVSELEELSKREQLGLGAERYHSPILAGVGQGATLAYAALAQAPAATVAGAVMVDPAARLATRVPLCPGAVSTPDPAGGFRYAQPSQPLPGELRTAADAGPGLVAAISALLAEPAGAAAPALAELPLVRIPAAEPGQLFAVIYSGDGGWRDLDKTIGEYLAARGVATVGVDSLRYFWRRRTPEQVARDLAAILADARVRTGASRALLIGYSFGAGVLPFAWNRLPESERAQVVQVSLLGLGSLAPFEFHLSGWLDRRDVTALPVLPELLRMDMTRLQCVYGQDEEDTL
jgi:type IV secretory pathway VirJ component